MVDNACLFIIFVYIYNIIFNQSPPLYETLFPAWFSFYYLGILARIRRNQVDTFIKKVGQPHWLIISCLLGICESIFLKRIGYNTGFYMSQIRLMSYFYSVTVVCYLINKEEYHDKVNGMVYIGNVSYGISYVHYFMLMIAGKFLSSFSFYREWIGYVISRFLLAIIGSLIVICVVKTICDWLSLKKIQKWIGFN